MRCLLAGINCVANYVYDILMHISSWSEHLSITRQVFGRVKSSGLTVKSSKCYVGDISVGFIDIKQEFLFTQQDTDEKVLKPPIPRTKTQIRAFLGLMVESFAQMRKWSD